ncbi:MAG: thiol reductant ABC exporter subunit CydD [Microbacteriaceae bacterium]|nr:thiol reductant ABC exporter subunit CydD [Microbacteriaceae bacterium]
MKPLDPRLLRYAKSVRAVLALGCVLGFVRTVAIVCWCWFVGNALATTVAFYLQGDKEGVVLQGAQPLDRLPYLTAGAFGALLVRSVSSWLLDYVSARGAIAAKAQLRQAALDALDRQSPQLRDSAATATALGRGLDALDGYFANYLPQLLLTGIATPILMVIVFFADSLSGIIVLIVFPVIPVFMILIGLATRSVQNKQWQELNQLSSSFLDTVTGLSTLRIFGRENKQRQRIERVSQGYRTRTMSVLRVAFLSGFVLDLAGTFSVALVAVTVGTRLVDGAFPLALGLFVLLVLPEVFIPIRLVGVAFHASTEGLAAAESIFELIERPQLEQVGKVKGENAGRVAISAKNVRLKRGSAEIMVPDFEIVPGEIVALAGPSGSGKSSIIAAINGFIVPESGSLDIFGETAWTGQKPGLLQGSVAENIALGQKACDLTLAQQVLVRVGLQNIDPDRMLGPLGAGLSGGQAQRLAIARCLYRAQVLNAQILLLDEPSSALDSGNEQTLIKVLREEAASGRAILLVSHRPQLLAAADKIVQIGGAV